MRQGIFIATFLSFLVTGTKAQTPVFSQYYASGLYTNPAWSGLEKDVYMGINYRSQWSNVGLPFQTFQFTYIHPLVKQGSKSKHLGGWGITLLNDVAGDQEQFKTQSITAGASYNFHLNRYGNEIIAVGFQAGGAFEKVDPSAFQWSSQYAGGGFDSNLPGETLFDTRTFYPALNVGGVYFITSRSKNPEARASLYQGASVYTLLQTDRFIEQSAARTVILVKMHGGLAKAITRRTELSGNYLVQYMNGAYQINAGGYLTYAVKDAMESAKVTLGAWYRLNDAWIFSLGFLSGAWNFGFSYDRNLSSLQKNFGFAQAFEFSMAYRISLYKGYKRFSSPLI